MLLIFFHPCIRQTENRNAKIAFLFIFFITIYQIPMSKIHISKITFFFSSLGNWNAAKLTRSIGDSFFSSFQRETKNPSHIAKSELGGGNTDTYWYNANVYRSIMIRAASTEDEESSNWMDGLVTDERDEFAVVTCGRWRRCWGREASPRRAASGARRGGRRRASSSPSPWPIRGG